MNLIAASEFVHIVFAALWTGGVVFVTWGVLPAARSGSLTARGVDTIMGRLRILSRASAILLVVSGGLLAGRFGSAILQTQDGHFVLGMVILWLLLIGFVELATKTVVNSLDETDVKEAAGAATGRFRAAGLVAILLLVDAGLLSAL